MLEITRNSAVLPITGPVPLDLDALLSPAQNLTHGYNIAEQTCFHKTTVSNLITSLKQISAAFKGLANLLQASTQLVSDSTQLVTDSTTLVSRTITLLGAVTTLVGALAGLVTTVIGLITAILGSLGGIGTALLIAAIAAIAAGALCALFWVPFAGPGLFIAGVIAIPALLAVVFFVIRGSIAAILGSLGALTGAIGTLTAPLGTLTAAVGGVTGILSNAALPSDVTRSLASVQTSLGAVQAVLSTSLPVVNSTVVTLDDQSTNLLPTFLAATPAGQTVIPRAHLQDTYLQAVAIYDNAVADLKLALPAPTNVGTYMLSDTNNAPQLNPSGATPPNVDTALKCVDVGDKPGINRGQEAVKK